MPSFVRGSATRNEFAHDRAQSDSMTRLSLTPHVKMFLPICATQYNKCSPKVCYRRTVQDSVPEVLIGSVPEPHAVNSTFAIVRYKKPEPRYEREARRNRQTATISVILR